MPPSELCFLAARELARLVRERRLSAVGLLEAHLAQITRVNPRLNAIGTLAREAAFLGLLIVGRYRREIDVLRLARAFEEGAGASSRRPPLAA